MPDTSLSGITINILLGLLGGAISGLSAHYFAPWFKWKLEIKRDSIAKEHEIKLLNIAATEAAKEKKMIMIKQWREMLENAYNRAKNENVRPESILQRSADYLALEPFLSNEAKRSVYGECRTITTGSEFQGALIVIKNEISRIEKEWGLLK